MVGGRICTLANKKTLHFAKTTNAKKTENPLHGSSSCAAAIRSAAHWMMGLEQSLRNPKALMLGGKPWGNRPGSDCGSVCRGGAEVLSTRWRSPWVNLRRSLRVGSWNVLSLRENDHLSLLSSELKLLDIGIAACGKTRCSAKLWPSLHVWRASTAEAHDQVLRPMFLSDLSHIMRAGSE